MHYLIQVYIFVVIVRSIISWIGTIPPNSFILLLRKLTDPVFRFVHKHLPFTIVGKIDIPPIIISVALYFADNIIIGMINQPVTTGG